jgi:hypothetical protein
MASDFKDLVRNQQWYKDEIEAAAEKRAMELLGGLLDEATEPEAPEKVTAEKAAVPRSVPVAQGNKTGGGYMCKWHNRSGSAGADNGFYATGPHGERLEVEKGGKRDKTNHWWLYKVNGQLINKCFTARDAKLSAEYAVSREK